MQGDFTRWTFRAEHDFRSVLLQQGRLLVDDGWNEQAEITAYHDEVRTLDVVGRSGGPAPRTAEDLGGFAIVTKDRGRPEDAAWEDLFITSGRYYVDGILCQAMKPPSADPSTQGWPLKDQQYLRSGNAEDGLPEPPERARYALYLDVWNHHVTADEEPSLLDPALGGPDTTTRARTVWQVRWTPLAEGETCSDLHNADWLARTPRLMSAGVEEEALDRDPCRITISGGYQRLENQLYRVQVHDPDEGETPPTFLWSRENGSVVAGLLDIREPNLTGVNAVLVLDRQGRDEELSFRQGDLVEVTSTDRQLRGSPGYLGTAGAPDGLELPVRWLDEARAPENLEELGAAPIVRRWEGGPTGMTADPRDPEGRIHLEDGIFVRFPEVEGGTARTGDYWQIPARTVRMPYGPNARSGYIDWPTTDGDALPLPPAGPEHHATPLAILSRGDSGWTLESDCRLVFPQLTDLVTLDLVGGDGQEAPPGEPLPEPVRVVVRNGGLPVEGAMVRFGAWSGALDTGPDQVSSEDVPTDSDGVAAFRWQLSPDHEITQTLSAQRLNDHEEPIDVRVVVTGRLSIPSAIAARTGGVHVTGLQFNIDGGLPFLNDLVYTPDDLASGITVDLDGPVLLGTVVDKPVVRVILSLPWPFGSDGDIWSEPPIGYRDVELAATWSADVEAKLERIKWDPRADDTVNTKSWLEEQLHNVLTEPGRGWHEPIIGRFMIDGWAIASRNDPRQHLNGHASAILVADRTLLRLPTDDEVTGGQFVQWFRLGAERTHVTAVLVPDVAGMPWTRAERELREEGLIPVREPDRGIEEAFVIGTEPEVGVRVDLFAQVRVFVSSENL